MTRVEPAAGWQNVRPPLCAIPAAFAMSCLVAALATDIAYWQTANVMWVDFSDWLITTGVVVGYIALLVALIEFFTVRRFRRWPAWPATVGYVIALVIATVDLLVHTRDAWTAVVPWGLALSALVVLILLAAGWMRRAARRRYAVAVPAAEVTR
jgi:uncharacterized membrane protein